MSKKAYLWLVFSAALCPLIPLTSVYAADMGTVTVEQKQVTYLGIKRLGDWGLASATGIVEGSQESYSEKRQAGKYTLTVTPPEGAESKVEVYEGESLIETFESRTTNGELHSGSTLRFSIIYTFTRVGNVSVNSNPPGIPFELRGPAGSVTDQTPQTYENRVEGTYTVYYKLPKVCKPAPPLSRKLDVGTNERPRIGFSYEAKCSALNTAGPPPKEQPPKEQPSKEEEPKPSPAPSRQTTQSPVRVSLTSGSAEVTAGGTARFTLVVLNRGDLALSGLTVDARYDGSKLEVSGANDARKSTNALQWTIGSLPAGGKWQTSFAGKVKEGTGNGDVISASATISGEALAEVPASQRSASVQIGALRALPPAGVPLLGLLTLIVFAASSFLSCAIAGVAGVLVRKW